MPTLKERATAIINNRAKLEQLRIKKAAAEIAYNLMYEITNNSEKDFIAEMPRNSVIIVKNNAVSIYGDIGCNKYVRIEKVIK